jgi:predicted dehydrogenase
MSEQSAKQFPSVNRMQRRDFLKTATTGAVGLAATAGMPAESYARILGANDRVRVGVVGFSDRFRSSLMPAFMKHATELDFEFVAVSDIWNRRRDEGVAKLTELGCRVKPFRNNEEMYGARATDAVMISTADFQHAYHGVEAIRAGQDAYIEKPLAHTMKDARAIRDAVKKSGRVVQIGTQRRSARNYQLANEYIKSGRFGDIVMAEMTWNVNQPGRWRRPELVASIRETDTDWKRYLIDLQTKESWDPRKYLEYRLFWPYSSGIPDQWMVHQIDTVHWFTDLPRPRSVVANGGVYLWKDGRTNWDTATIVFDYGPLDDPSKGFQVVYASRMTNAAGDVKEYYYSNGGMLNLDTNEVTATGGLTPRYAAEMQVPANQLESFKLADAVRAETSANTGVDEATSNNVRNWMECIRSRKTPNADIEAGYNHSVALCMTIAAMHTGRKATFNDVAQEVVAQ